MPRKVFCSSVLLLFSFALTLTSQETVDTALTLPPLEVAAPKIRHQSTGGTLTEWTVDSLEKLPVNNLTDLLATETGTFIKSYGQGSLATSSIRGGSAGHTLVLWNGLPIQSPMLGQVDLALLPIDGVESILFQRGSGAALWGSGAIGGVITLANEADFDNRLYIRNHSQIGDFGRYQQHVKLGIGNARFQSVTRLIYQEAKNDFNYFVAPGLPERQQSNAQLFQHNILQDLYWKLTPRQFLTVHYWRQSSDREIPPTNVQNRSEAHQDDRADRLILQYRHVADRSVLQAKTAVFDEYLNYFDDLTTLEARNHFRTYLSEITNQWTWGNRNQLLLGGTHLYTQAWSAGYEGIPSENRSAAFFSWQYSHRRWKTQLSARQEIVDGDIVPLIPALGFDYQLNANLQLKGKASKNYRLPTLNDRYWLPGGNPGLLPETGWSQELTLEQKWARNGFQLTVSSTFFNRNINNWILWSRREGQQEWFADNIAKVWSRGVEPRFAMTYRWRSLRIKWRGGYDYIRSTNQIALSYPNVEAGEQLIYTPIHQAFSTLSVAWRGWSAAYQHTYTGPTIGINESLTDYQVGNVRFQYGTKGSFYRGTVFLTIYNVWNTNYLIVERRPMPGINYQAGITIHLNKNP